MKLLLRSLVALILVGGVGAAIYFPAIRYWKKRNEPKWRFSEVTRGDIVAMVNSTGTVRPVLSVHVGALVSGPVDRLFADFNDEVSAGELLAQIDPTRFEAAVARDEAALKSREAELKRVQALLDQAIADERRAIDLQKVNPDFISEAELDQLKYSRQSLEAQLELARAAVDQATANLSESRTNLDYTKVTSPVDGIVIDRKIDEGQALAAQFQTPELFIVAPDLKKEMRIFASVDETDIGLIRQAQQHGQPVFFTVDAYPDDLFEGTIHEIRLSSIEMQNVVTYPVVISAPNPDMKLLPGMTANISFRVDERKDVVRIPNAALRFYPEEKHVHPDDRKLLRGETWEKEDDDQPEAMLTAVEKAELRRKRRRRHVWTWDGKFLHAVEVEFGLMDGKYAELVTGEVKEGQKLVIGKESGS